MKTWAPMEERRGDMMRGQVCLPSIPTTEIDEGCKDMEYSGKTE